MEKLSTYLKEFPTHLAEISRHLKAVSTSLEEDPSIQFEEISTDFGLFSIHVKEISI